MIRYVPRTLATLGLSLGLLLGACGDSDDKTTDASADATTADVRDSSVSDPDTSMNDDGAVHTPDATTPDASDMIPNGAEPLFVGVGYGMRRSYSLDGETWMDGEFAQPQGDDENLLRGVGFDHGRFMAVGNRVQYSDDGETWTDGSYTENSFLSDVVYLNGVWVAAGGNGARASSSDDGETFVSRGSYIEGHFRGIAAGNGVAIAVGHGYGSLADQGLYAVTSDGITWSPEVTGGPRLARIAFANGMFVAVGREGRCMRSTNGTSWSDCTVVAEDLASVRVVAGAFLVRTEAGVNYRSTDGVSFAEVQGENVPDLLTYGNGTYVGSNWTRLFRSSALSGPYDQVYNMDPGFGDIVFGYRERP